MSIYPVDGLALADWPLGFIDRGDEEKSELFDELQEYLLSDVVQQELLDQGRRTNPFTYEMNEETVDPEVFNPDWGIDVERIFDPIVIPAAPVLFEALESLPELLPQTIVHRAGARLLRQHGG